MVSMATAVIVSSNSTVPKANLYGYNSATNNTVATITYSHIVRKEDVGRNVQGHVVRANMSSEFFISVSDCKSNYYVIKIVIRLHI